MAKIFKVHKLVEKILVEQPKTRSDDYLLTLEVLKYFIETDLSLEEIFENHVLIGLPSLETIRRSRAKIQSRCPALAADKETLKIRKQEEKEYRAYALNK